jgi:hypothetical protein
MQDIPSLDPTAQDEEDVWETVRVMAGGNTSPPLATEDIVPEGAQEHTTVVESQPSVEEVQSPPPAAAVAVEQPEDRIEEPPIEAGAASEASFVDLTRILGTPTVTIVRSTLQVF